MPRSPSCTSEYLSLLIESDPECLFWRSLFFDPSTFDMQAISGNVDAMRLQIMQNIFENCKNILSRRFCKTSGQPSNDIEIDSIYDIVSLMRQQQIDAALVYRALGKMCSGMRDQLDDLATAGSSAGPLQEYSKYCTEICLALVGVLGPALANDRTIPQLRLLAGILGSGASGSRRI